jgi:hypothetical protein
VVVAVGGCCCEKEEKPLPPAAGDGMAHAAEDDTKIDSVVVTRCYHPNC